MKTILCCLIANFFFIQLHATDYYSQGSVSPNLLSNWNTNPQGGGTLPATFTNQGDRFIIQANHSMITSETWTVGGAGTILEIQNNGSLQGDHGVFFNGSFQINDGGTYIHNNKASVDESAGNSIFGGIEIFAANSRVEIRNWPAKNIGLPNAYPGISWGDLIINLQSDISADGLPWNWNISDGSTLTIKGDLDVRATYVSIPSELQFTSSGIQLINVHGNLSTSGYKTKVSIKNSFSLPLDGYTTMQVNGNISLADGVQLNIGSNTTYASPYGLYELRFKGNFSSVDNSLLLYDPFNPVFLVANGTSPQTFGCLWNLNRNFRVAEGAIVNLTTPLTMAATEVKLVISGILNQNSRRMTLYSKIECAGGVFNASGIIYIGDSCTACSNLNGIYDNTNRTWCTPSGTKGRINFLNSSVSLDNSGENLLTAGSSLTNSPGEIYFINSFASSLYDESPVAVYSVYENSVFSLDMSSYLGGNSASYQGRGGTLRIGSADGITATGNLTGGNIRTGIAKDYNFSGSNSFEYFGTTPQVTGNGLPSIIDRTLIINNSAGMGTTGVTLSSPTSVRSSLDLISGKLTTSMPNLIILDKNAIVNQPVWGASYVVGPVKKIGNTSFRFPVGKGNNFAPLTLSGNGTITDEYVAEYFMADPAQTIGSSFDNPPVDHLSESEWWSVSRINGTSTKNVTLEATAYTDAILLSDLRVMRWDSLAWRNEGNTSYSGISAGQVTSDIVTDFFATGIPTPFTFGSIGPAGNPLAVNLLSFNAIKLTDTKSFLTWQLANNSSPGKKFEIEKANSNRSFTRLAVINGTASIRSYNYTDNDLKTGINYYRLKITDENGKITYSRVVAILNGVDGLLLTSLTPTVIANTASLTVYSSKQLKLDLVITDIQGKTVRKEQHTVGTGNSTLHLPVEQLTAGVYHIYGIAEEGRTNIIRFIKQ